MKQGNRTRYAKGVQTDVKMFGKQWKIAIYKNLQQNYHKQFEDGF